MQSMESKKTVELQASMEPLTTVETLEHTVVRCAEGHVFATSSFPMQQLGSDRIGPGRLIRCPRCARLRSSVPVVALRR
ncbi:hypothetical protein OG233_14700 [Streptomyces sp. NBC_01218]|uniref:hypothetical protein n=1 Tax=unclassified Streptomyces TaxID=2593676 RepID=UPI0023B98B32|nr:MULTISPECIES: hypothetical protein [unclassified Streptomyces]WEH43939.1 hypothetical protein PZB77_14255 [Streptomyces sp. AM 2-1-1]WSQ55590.1 hypothetical protein OG233_14700 [Streptomyces sp. NBC_01218]